VARWHHALCGLCARQLPPYWHPWPFIPVGCLSQDKVLALSCLGTGAIGMMNLCAPKKTPEA
jgi:hypothetical protein